jgi:hypothetical protein
MRITILTWIFVLSIQLAGQANGEPVLSFIDNSYDFGRIYEDRGKVNHTFTLKNTGSSPLVIFNVRSNCGCTSPAWTKEPVEPGEDGFIIVEYDPRNARGSFHKTIQVQSNASNSNMFLTISGKVVPPLKKEKLYYNVGDLSIKSKHINLGYLYKGTTGHALLTIANLSEKPITLDLTDVPAQIESYYIPEELQPGEYGQIEIQYNTEKVEDWDVVIDRISLVINGKENIRNLLAVTANIREDFRNMTEEELLMAPVATFRQSSINFDTIPEAGSLKCQFYLKNTGKSDLIIRAVKPSCGITVESPEVDMLAPGESTCIVANLNTKGRPGDFKNSITVITNDPDEYKQYLVVEGFIK